MIKTVVLYYHSIAPKRKADWVRSYLTHELHVFEAALNFLVENNYKVITLEEAFENNWLFKEKTACLTFDDGFADFFIYAYPLLKKYKMHGTLFVSTEFVEDYRNSILPTMEDYWSGKKTLSEIEYWGYVNWEEMRIMEESGWVGIESHTATHMKYPYKAELKDIHRPGSNSLYPIGQIYPELKTRYIRDADFEKKLPYGYPFFLERSAVVTRIHYPNKDLVNEITAYFKSWDWSNFNKAKALIKANEILDKYKIQNNVFERVESDEEMASRLKYEIVESKQILEEKLGHSLKFLCWPHGDNDENSHRIAMEAGFSATTLGSKIIENDWSERIPPRFSNSLYKGSVRLGLFKMRMKISEYQGSFVGQLSSKLFKLLK
jgi:peptidoglycan/xylan/chitin deacetylase (PgdA/CDA1 family)